VTAHRSILFLDSTCDDAESPLDQPDFFGDLNLDKVERAITEGQDESRLEELFRQPLRTSKAVVYRQKVSRDLEDPGLFARITAFNEAMTTMRSELAVSAKVSDPPQSHRWFLQAATTYVDAVVALSEGLTVADLASSGLSSARDRLNDYWASEAFVSLQGAVRAANEDLARVRYRLELSDISITVSRYEGETDLSADLAACFERFRQIPGRAAAEGKGAGVEEEEPEESPTRNDLSYFSEKILHLVVRHFPETFASLAEFCDAFRDFPDPVVTEFDREVRFYTSYLGFLAPLRAEGLSFCHPVLSSGTTRLKANRAFDLALAAKLLHDGLPLVPNDVVLEGEERLLVVTGPNQGGKTTFARMIGQLHYLASLGLPVPGKGVRLRLRDQIFTHFEREEFVKDGLGKFEDELVRLRAIVEKATPSSLIILNEIFTSTSREDAVLLGARVLEWVLALDAVCVYVTFIDEHATPSSSTVSMASTVEEGDAARRTFKMVRKHADGLAYASAIARKHGLDSDSLKARLQS
jgi:DNA mismatch repair protein MutS